MTAAIDLAPARTAPVQDGIRPLPFRAAGDITIPSTSVDVVERLLVREQISLLWGAYSSGKSTLALDVVCRVAAGMPFFGRRVRSGPAVYVAAEAGASIDSRVIAWKRHHGVDDFPAAFVVVPVDLSDPLGDPLRLTALLQDLDDATKRVPALCVIDTLSRAFGGGDENSSVDMGQFVKNLDYIRSASGAHVAIVHHGGKDNERGARGHSLLAAAADTIIEIKNSDGTITATVRKQRDLPGGDEFVGRLTPIDVGLDSWGNTLTACVLEPLAGAPATRRPVKLPKGCDIAFRALKDAISEWGEALPHTSAIPPGTRAVGGESWRRVYYRLDAADGEQPKQAEEARRKRFLRARLALQNAGSIGAHGDHYWINQ